MSDVGRSYEDYPFHDPNWLAIRHRGNHKVFAWIFGREVSQKLKKDIDKIWKYDRMGMCAKMAHICRQRRWTENSLLVVLLSVCRR